MTPERRASWRLFRRVAALTAALAALLLVGAFLRGGGVPAFLLAEAAGLAGLARYRACPANVRDWRTPALGLALGFSLALYFVGVRSGTSFADSVFILSLAGVSVGALLASLGRVSLVQGTVVAGAAPIVAWAFCASWEFPSTFSPFRQYGHFEALQLALPLALGALAALRESAPLVRSRLFWAAVTVGGAAGALVESSGQLFLPGRALATVFLLAVAGAAFVAAVSRAAAADEGANRGASAFVAGLALVPAAVTAVGYAEQLRSAALPTPLEATGVGGGLLLAVAALLALRGAGAARGAGVPAGAVVPLAVALATLALPLERNLFAYEGYRASFVSHGWEFLGPYATAWAGLAAALAARGRRRWVAGLAAVTAALGVYLAFTARAFHVFPQVPYELFKALGTPEASWAREPLLPWVRAAAAVSVVAAAARWPRAPREAR